MNEIEDKNQGIKDELAAIADTVTERVLTGLQNLTAFWPNKIPKSTCSPINCSSFFLWWNKSLASPELALYPPSQLWKIHRAKNRNWTPRHR
jgi:hypothetical protein